jgi:riboflavin biosynthesis pyrimidine reductase
VLLLCPADRAAAIAAESRPGVRVVAVPAKDRMQPADILDVLAGLGQRRVVCEGGPSLATDFAAAGVIDEYCLTVAPAIEPADHPFLRLSARHRLETKLAGMLVDAAGFSYLRLRVVPPAR